VSSLEDSFRAMHRLLRGEASPAEAAAELGASEERLAAYQGFVRGHIAGVLEKNFTVLPELLGPDAWGELRTRYFAEVPAGDFELNANAAAFPGWLAEQVEAGEPGLTEAHAELCELEWQEFAAFADEAELPDPATLPGPTLNPTLRILELRYPIAGFLAAWRRSVPEARPELPTEEAPGVVFVFRDPETLDHAFAEADDNLLFAFKVVHDEIPLEAAAAAVGADEATVRRTLEEAVSVGLLHLPAGPAEPGPPTGNA